MKRLAVIAAMAGFLALPIHGTASAASTPTVTFSFSGVPAGSKVILVGLSTAKEVPQGAKKMQLPSSFKRRGEKTYRFSIHILNPSGRYVGPVVFGVAGSSNKWTTNVVTTKSMKLGKLTYKTQGWAKSSTKLAKGQYGRLLKGAAKDGRPKGSGGVGVVFKLGVSAAAANKSAAQVCPADVDQELGGDCDGDGVLNAVDVDDDNDAVMDVADSTTEDFPSAGWMPTASIRTNIGGTGSLKTLNANINTSTLDADIDNAFGGSSSTFALGFFFNLDNTEARAVDAGWIDCGELEYCSAATGTATTGPTSTPMNPFFNEYFCPAGKVNGAGGCMADVLWKDFTGYRVIDGKGSKVEDKGTGITNGMQFSASPEGVMWAGVMKPKGITEPLKKIKVGDPYLAKMRYAADGTIKTVPMSLGAFFVTSPAISKINDVAVDYTKASPTGSRYNAVVLSDSGVLDMWFYRPQRLAIEGADPAGAKYIDLGGLDYGFNFEADPQITEKLIKSRSIDERGFGCGKQGAYTLSDTLTEITDGTGGGIESWNIHDSATDAAPAADRMLHVVMDFKKCVQGLSKKLYVDSTRLASDPYLEIHLIAAGANTTGGRSSALQSFTVKLPASASTWATK